MKPLKQLLETHTLREGDHFHWQYDDSVEKCEFTYWCKSRMCVYGIENTSRTYFGAWEKVPILTH